MIVPLCYSLKTHCVVKQPAILDVANPTAQMTLAHDAHPAKEVLIWKQVMGWERPPVQGRWRDSLAGSHGRGGGHTFPCSRHGSCHGNDQLPITRMHALPCLAAHSRDVLCSQGKIYIPSLAQKGSTPLPGCSCSRQAINWVIFPALLSAVGREGQNMHHW